MERMNYTESREKRFVEAIQRACAEHEPVIIDHHDRPSVVLLSLEDYQALKERCSADASPS